MSEHSHDHGVATADHPADEHYRFEKQELAFFGADDSDAGRNIGVMLALLFCVLLALTIGVSIWTVENASVSDDPHHVGEVEGSAGH